MRGITGQIIAALLVIGFSAAQASALDVTDVSIWYGVDRVNGASPDFYAEIEVKGTGITDVTLYDTATAQWMPCTFDAGDNSWQYDDEGYNSLVAFQAVHANPTLLNIYVNATATPGIWEAQTSFAYSVSPPGVMPNITNPTHGQTGVSLNPVYQWDSLDGQPGVVLFDLYVDERWPGGDEAYWSFPETDTTKTTWQPGELNGLAPYNFGIEANNFAAGVVNLAGDDTGNFNYWGLWGQGNSVDFTTEVPEPWSMTLLGTGILFVIGYHRRRRMS